MPTNQHKEEVLLGLDVGEKRIGVALKVRGTLICRPLVTLANDAGFRAKLVELLHSYQVSRLVVGLPRNLEGNETAQTEAVRTFVEDLTLEIPRVWQDEAATSIRAKELLDERGLGYTKGDIDALSAAIILEDYVNEG